MADSSSFTSLLALVNTHLSKTSIQDSTSENTGNSFNIPTPSFRDGNTFTQSDTRLGFLPNRGLPKLNVKSGESSIDSVLAEQVSNMLKAKALKKQQEEDKIRQDEEMRMLKLKEEEDVIDLMEALQNPDLHFPLQKSQNETISNSSSFESLFEPQFIDCDLVPERPPTPEPTLPCTTDMSYILNSNVKGARGSSFGKVLTSRLRPVAAPYMMTRVNSSVQRFDFSSPSPCDVIKEKLKRPSCYNAYSFNIFG